MRVAVVGLGIAGLRTATLLERAGVEVVSFEAKPGPGGRVETSFFGDGTAYESGGEWIDSNHERVKSLVTELGLVLKATPDIPRQVIYEQEQTTDDTIWPEAKVDSERVDQVSGELSGPVTLPAWKNDLPELDAKTVEDLISAHTSSARGHWWVTAQIRSDEGEDPARVGLLGWLAGLVHYRERGDDGMSAFRVEGGWGAVANAMRERLKHQPNFSTPVTGVIQTGWKVHLDLGDSITDEFDAVVLTLPPPLITDLQWSPPLPAKQASAFHDCRLSRAIKVAFRFNRPWWKDYYPSGSFHVSGRLQQLWDGSQGSGHVLLAYICGQESVGLNEQIAREEFDKQFPGVNAEILEVRVHDWNNDPFARGAFSHLAPGYVTGSMRWIATPTGQVFFAGEHTATWTGFIEGALESAERVVAEILR